MPASTSIISAATADATASIGQHSSVWGPSTLHLNLVGTGSAALVVRNDVMEIHRRSLSWAAEGTLDIALGSLQGVVTVQIAGMSTTGSVSASLQTSATPAVQEVGYPTLAALLADTPAVGTRAICTDVPDAALAYTSAGWTGFLGTFTAAQFAALPTTNLASYSYVAAETGPLVYSRAITSTAPGSPSAPFASTAARNAAYAGQTWRAGVFATVAGIGETEWIGPTNVDWGELVSQINVTKYTKAIAAITGGQSNENGKACVWDNVGDTPLPITFKSQTSPVFDDPISPTKHYFYANIRTGSWWPKMIDCLRSSGVEIRGFFNAALGSSSLRKHWVGENEGAWSANAVFYTKRSTIGGGDSGDKGSFVRSGTKLFQCVAGGKTRYIYYSSDTPYAFPGYASLTYIDYLVVGNESGLSGAVAPNWGGAAAIGNTVNDGALTWEYVADVAWTGVHQFVPGEVGFDPFGQLARCKALLDAQVNCDKWFLWSNGQSDWSTSAANFDIYKGWYKGALNSLVSWCVANGYKLALGSTCGSPAGIMSNGKYPVELINESVDEVIATTALATVVRGGNLFAALGPNPRTYPDSGVTTPGIHLRDVEYPLAGQEWGRALRIALGV